MDDLPAYAIQPGDELPTSGIDSAIKLRCCPIWVTVQKGTSPLFGDTAMSTIVTCLTSLFFAAPAPVGLDPPQDKPKTEAAKAEETATPQQQFNKILQDFVRAQSEFSKALETAK